MGHPTVHAVANPDKPAVIMAGSGEIITYGALDARSNQCAHLFRALGLQHGDTVAFCLENCAEFFDLVWGAQRAGLIYVAISCRLTPSEMDYILNDSGAVALPAVITARNTSMCRWVMRWASAVSVMGKAYPY